MSRTLVTGGAGYIGAHLVDELGAAGREVRVLDVVMHDQRDVVDRVQAAGAEVIEADIRDGEARRRALEGVTELVHLAAIVGDPACARDPQEAQAVNVAATQALVDEARDAGVSRMVFASTCSNYGRMEDPTVPITEEGELRPVSLYAEQKVAIERMLLDGDLGGLTPTCVRFATVYGVAPRMRFDLTINEFTRDLWADRELAVFGEQFWRPYIHVRDAARAVLAVLEAPQDRIAGEVFNAGRSGENYRKLDLVEAIQSKVPTGSVSYVKRDEDPRDYKVSFDKVREVLGFETLMTVPDGIDEILESLSRDQFGDPYDDRYRN
jgi:nucleoside-diphosphate-sugar epimerase